MDEPMVSAEILKTVLAKAPFLKPYSFSLKNCASGECTLAVPFTRSLERPGGVVSGITLMAAADVAMWLAIMTLRGTEECWVTSDMKTAFLKSAREEDLLCTARIMKPGRRFIYGTAECYGVSSGLMTHHVITYVKVGKGNNGT